MNQVEALEELRELFKNNIGGKIEFFAKYFPTIESDSVVNYVVIFPEAYKEQLSALVDYNWVFFSTHTDEVVAYDSSSKPYTESMFTED